jgi:hypothetical protein
VSQTNVDQSLLLKIQKLLALATSPNEHEAKAAATKAQELLIRHNLTAEDVELKTEQLDDKYESKTVYENKRMELEVKWVRDIIQWYFFVDVVWRDARIVPFHKHLNKPARVFFIGKKTNVQVASYVFDFLRHKYWDLWEEYKAHSGAHNHVRGAYWEGLTHGICYQLEAGKKRVQEETALVIRKDPNIKKAVEKYHGNIRTVQPVKPMVDDSSSYSEGAKAGKALKIARGLGSSGGSSNLSLDHKKGG